MNADSDTERYFGNKIKTYLDGAAANLAPGTTYRLQEARRRALERMATADAGHPVSAGGGSRALALAGGPRRARRGKAWLWLAVLLLAGGLLYADHWRTVHEQASELGEIDAELLASDVPYDAFLDRGFQNWLSHGEDR